jgi:DNA invertase Pin-like site-specific DNA recombinase
MTGELAGRWLRVSTGAQDETTQLPDVDAWCTSHGYQVTRDYVLHGKSAFKGKQDEELERMLADMRAGVITVLVVWKADRIERRGAYNAFDLARRVREAGGRIEYVTDSFLNDANEMSDVMLALVATKSRIESKDKSDRILNKHRALREAGSLVGRTSWPFRVVKLDDGRKVPAPDPEAAAWCRRAVARYVDEDVSLREIGTWLDWNNVATHTGCPWSPVSLSQVFRNPALIGRRVDGSGRTILKHEGIIDRETWTKLQAKLDGRAHRRGLAPSNTLMLTGVARCPKCDGPMYKAVSSTRRQDGTSNKIVYYRCHGNDRAPSKCKNMIRADKLDEFVSDFMASSGGYVVREVIRPGSDRADDLAELERDLRELDFDAPDFAQQQAALLAERARLKALPPEPARITETLTALTVGSLWSQLDSEGRRAYLLATGVQVYAHKSGMWVTGDETRAGAFGWAPPGGWPAEAATPRVAEFEWAVAGGRVVAGTPMPGLEPLPAAA